MKMTADFTLETMEAKGSNTDFFKSSVPNQNSVASENTLQEWTEKSRHSQRKEG